MSYHFSSFKWLFIRKAKDSKCQRELEKLEHLYTVGRKAKWCSHYEKQYTKN